MKRSVLFLILVSLYGRAMFCQTEGAINYELGGYVKDLQILHFTDNIDSLTSLNLVHNRINFKWFISEHFTAKVECRNRIFYGEQVKLVPGFGRFIDTDDGYIKLSALLVDSKSLVMQAKLDRVLLNYSSAKVSLTAGRQRINWGINTIWNPNDLFNAYSFLDFDYEERPGVDAMRAQFFIKTFSSFELAYKPSAEKDQSVAAALFKFNKWKYDFQFLAGLYRADMAVGVGWAGNIRNTGFKGEATCFIDKGRFPNKGVVSASITFDRSFKHNWYMSAAMLFQSKPDPALTINPLYANTQFTAKYLMPFRYTYYISAAKSFTPILSASLAVIHSPANNSTIFFPSIVYNACQNVDVDVTMQSFFSKTDGVFKTQGNSLFFRMKFSF